ncbi:MAG: HAD-IA family hydrolase [Acetatifactor sp.]|nr:HAD-IA family hydrolase [Acetatifactor sp.]
MEKKRTLPDPDFLWFAEQNHEQYDFVLLSNEVKEWSKYLFELHRLHKYFKDSIVSGEIHIRKPENRIFLYAIQRIQRDPQECIFVDNSVRNLTTAQEFGINSVLFNRDQKTYFGNIVNDFRELDNFLKDI